MLGFSSCRRKCRLQSASGDINLDEQGDPTASTYDVWAITTGDEEEVLKSIDFGS